MIIIGFTKKLTLPFLLIALLFSLSFNIYLTEKLQKSPIEAETFKVVAVLDGDTFILEGDQAIRLAAIDAP